MKKNRTIFGVICIILIVFFLIKIFITTKETTKPTDESSKTVSDKLEAKKPEKEEKLNAKDPAVAEESKNEDQASILATSKIPSKTQQSSSSIPAPQEQYASTIYYYPDGKTTKSVEEYNQKNGKKIKITNYESDGKTIQYVEEYNANGNKIKRIKYDRSNNIDYIDEYNDDGDKIKYSEYIYASGSNVVQKIIVKQYDPSNSRLISHKVVDKQGKLLQTIV